MIIPAIRNTIKNTIIDPLHGADFKALIKAAGGVLYLDARKATGNGLPSNNPLTGQWMDLSGLGNNATPTNMAGTTASGVDISDPLRPCWVLEGTDDFFSMVNTASVDITSAPLAIFATVKIATGAAAGYIVSKNGVGNTERQYGLLWDTQSVRAVLQSSARGQSAAGSVPENQWHNVGFTWDGVNVVYYIDGVVSGDPVATSTVLTSRPNMQVGRRETVYYNGCLATVTIYAGAKATDANTLKAEREISKSYIGG
jgi:hypothetical protein